MQGQLNGDFRVDVSNKQCTVRPVVFQSGKFPTGVFVWMWVKKIDSKIFIYLYLRYLTFQNTKLSGRTENQKKNVKSRCCSGGHRTT
jgi:hypothetical protein